MHADLHPGNILVQGTACISTSCKEQTAIVDLCDTLVVEVQPPFRQLCLVLLDAGIVAELQSADMQNFRAVFTAVVQGQVRSLSWHLVVEVREQRQLESLVAKL